MPRGKRRRVVRLSDAEDMDRSMDRPDHGFANEKPADEQREVLLDPESEDSLSGDEFWREQRPPHHG